jgi:hypothetical protein
VESIKRKRPSTDGLYYLKGKDYAGKASASVIFSRAVAS